MTRPSINNMVKKFNRPNDEFLERSDGRIEWVCFHGVGHTVWAHNDSGYVHGCDGCCKKLKEEQKQAIALENSDE